MEEEEEVVRNVSIEANMPCVAAVYLDQCVVLDVVTDNSPSPGQPGCFADEIAIFTGTHHLRFVVDGVITTSRHMPTTVDLANNLVNYIIVSAEDVGRRHPSTIDPSIPTIVEPIPSATTETTDQLVSGTATASDNVSSSTTPSDASAAETKTQTVDKHQQSQPQQQALQQQHQEQAGSHQQQQQEAKRPRTRSVRPLHEYMLPIPQYLAEWDQPDDSPAYRHAQQAMAKLPAPPLLPGFLARPLLNAPMVAREDNSVLMLPPNHTVLNHLATCSIKNQTLAVTATTRYKNKVSCDCYSGFFFFLFLAGECTQADIDA